MTMATDTAVVTEPGNAPIEPETTPQEQPIEPAAEPEAVEAEEPEAAAPPQPEVVADPLDTLDDAALMAHPRVHDRFMRESESVRRRAERETEQRIQQARVDYGVSGAAFADITQAYDAGDAQRAQALLNIALGARDWKAVEIVDQVGRDLVPGGRIAVEDQNRLDAALIAAQRGTGTLNDYAKVVFDVRAKAYAENVLAPQIEARISKDLQAKAKAAEKTAQVKAAEAVNAERPGPTLGVPGAGTARTMLTSAEVESIPTSVFLNLSKEVQQRLVTETREADRLYPNRNDRAAVQAALGR